MMHNDTLAEELRDFADKFGDNDTNEGEEIDRDIGLERELYARLLSRPERDRLLMIIDLIDYDPAIGLEFAQNCLKDSQSFETLLRKGLAEGDASSIGHWFRILMPLFGILPTIKLLEEWIQIKPYAVSKAVYHIMARRLIPGKENEKIRREVILLGELAIRADEEAQLS
jgi:hypothetical protein